MRLRAWIWILGAVVPSLVCGSMAAERMSAEQWDLREALIAGQSVDWQATREELVTLTVSAGPGEVIALLAETRHRQDWPAPARDAAIHAYVQGLRDLAGWLVPPEVLVWLESYRPLVLVPHEDHAGGAVPLYPVRAALHGVQNTWRRREALPEGTALLAANPRALADAWLLETHPAVRAGYLDALRTASEEALLQLARHATERAMAQPRLGSLAAPAALLAGQARLLARALTAAPGPHAAPLLSEAAMRLDPVYNLELMQSLLDTAEPGLAGVAMAQLYPALAEDPLAAELLLGRLGDEQLGAAAALALGRSAPADTIELLAELSAGEPGLAASRARLALETRARMLESAASP